MARALAVLTHAVTLLLVLATALVLVVPIWLPFKIAIAGVLLLLAWQVRPRLPQLPDGTLLQRAEAPHLFAHLDALASKVEGRVPAWVVVDAGSTAGAGPAGGGHLRIGLPLWVSIERPGHDALLAELLGSLAASDPVVASAVGSLHEWDAVFRPGIGDYDHHDHEDSWTFMDVYEHSAMSRMRDLTISVLLLPLWVPIVLLRRAMAGQVRRLSADAEARGRAAVEVLGDATAVAALRRGRGEVLQQLTVMEAGLRLDRDADVWPPVPDSDAVDADVRQALPKVNRALRDAARA